MNSHDCPANSVTPIEECSHHDCQNSDHFVATVVLELAREEIQKLKQENEKLKHQLEHCRDALRELTDLGAPASILADYALRNLTEMEKE